MSDESDVHFSDEEFDDEKQSKIVENILHLNKHKPIKKAVRREPALKNDELSSIKSIVDQKGSVEIEDFTKYLKFRKTLKKVGTKVEAIKKKSRTLPKPLEKPLAERVRRTVGYEKNRLLFDRWEAFVTSNRAQAHQVFPLPDVAAIKIEQNSKPTNQWRFKSDLEKELEKFDDKVEEYHIEDVDKEDEKPISMEMVKERRKEAAKLRAIQSYVMAKARRQNKIKSKKYHRIMRKEKIKQALKEFEELQKTDPEEALKKLEEIEKSRALERYSLRHKGTGQWAKNKQIRAKYDKESRRALAEQLQISRKLTEKPVRPDSDSDNETIVEPMASAAVEEELANDSNLTKLWMRGVQPSEEVTNFLNTYDEWRQNPNIDDTENNAINQQRPTPEISSVVTPPAETIRVTSEDAALKSSPKPKIKKSAITKKTKKSKKVTRAPVEADIEELFEEAEQKVAKKIKKKLLEAEKETKPVKSNTKKVAKGKKSKAKVDLAMPSQGKKQIIDEELIEKPLGQEDAADQPKLSTLTNILQTTDEPKPKKPKTNPKQTKPKPVSLDSAQPDLIVMDDNEDEAESQRKLMMEVMEDPDICKDFVKEKKSIIEEEKPKSIDLNLPGWGSWAGAGIDPKKQRKRRRFIVKMPEVLPRRDENQGSLIINEKASAQIKRYQVSEVPFPFQTVKDYEASIRAPIGDTFVPHSAFKRFIRPAVETKMGTIIEPANSSLLMGLPKRVR